MPRASNVIGTKWLEFGWSIPISINFTNVIICNSNEIQLFPDKAPWSVPYILQSWRRLPWSRWNPMLQAGQNIEQSCWHFQVTKKNWNFADSDDYIVFLASAMLFYSFFFGFCRFRIPPDMVMGIMVWEPRLAAGQTVLLLPIPLLSELLQIAYAETWKEALVPRSATQLAKFTKHFFQLHFDHQRPEISINHTFELHDWTLQVAEVPAQDSTHHQYGGTTQVKAIRFWVL